MKPEITEERDSDPASVPTASPVPSAPTPYPSAETPPDPLPAPNRNGLLRRLGGRLRGGLGRLIPNSRDEALPEVSPPAPPPVVAEHPNRLLQHSPFSTGFFGAMGVIGAVLLFQALSQVQNIIILAVMSLFLALGLSPVVEFLVRRRWPRGLAVAVVALGVLGVVAGGVWALVPIVSEQVQALSGNIPFWLNNLLQNEQFAQWNRDYDIIRKVNDFLVSDKLVEQTFGGILGAGKLLANLVFSVIMTLVLTIYFLASLPAIKDAIYHLAPASRRARVRYLADEIFRGIGGYLTGMFIVVSIAATCAFIFMQFVGLRDYALALAFVVALFCFIPLVGSSLAMAAVALVGFGVSPTTGTVTIIYFLCYQQFDAYVVYPSVMGRTVRVPGVLVVLSAIIGGILFGVIGALIAIPTAAALLLLYREVLLPHLDSK
ncbi:MAG: AI-2E family transporter [Propionibacteriaceae bacterium]|nr:AI-2E family transporter [Propionibacteriaceae bacterium]